MSPDSDIVKNRLSHISDMLNKISVLMKDVSLDIFKSNYEKHYAILHLLQNCIEATSDIASHICSFDSLGVPNTYSDAFEILERNSVISKKISNEMQEAARFRNRIVHLYNIIDLEIVYQIATSKVNVFEDFCAEIVDYIK